MYLIQHFILFLIFFPGAIAQPNTGDSIQPNRIVIDQKVNDAFQDGEWFRFRMRYGFSMPVMQQLQFAKQPSKTKLFIMLLRLEKQQACTLVFKVDDYFDSYFEKDIVRPIRFVRIFQRETINVMLKLTLTTTLNRALCTIC